ncbi:MAG: S1 RNA-binding domain-containing protein, partial [Candidatus Parcubacteria bacterium]|nr:S1 RNA-binding domain-containing protein [Candidatus Parcubacteria bacterium]
MFDLKTLGMAVKQISEEKGIPEEKVLEAIEMAIAAAYKKEYAKKTEVIKAKFNLKTGDLKFWQSKLVVDESMLKEDDEEDENYKSFNDKDALEENKKIRFNPDRHIMLEDALKINKKIKVEEELLNDLELQQDFSRIAAQTAKQVILQKLHDAEREFVISTFKDKEGTIVSGIIQRLEGKNIYVDLGKTVGIMFANEIIPGERYRIGERKKFYILSIDDKPRGPVILLSRSHPKFIAKLFETEVPEIGEGLVEI